MISLRKMPWVKIALTGSLMLNLLIAGLVVGAVTSRDESRKALPLERERAQVAFLAVLPREHRDSLRAAVSAGRQDRSAERARADAEQAAFLEALRRPEVTAQEIAALLEAQRLRRDASAERFEILLSQEIARMSPALREDYAKRLERVRRWDHDKHRDKPKNDRDH